MLNMARRRLSDVAIAITILVFMIGGFEFIIASLDSSIGFTGGVSNDLISLKANISGASSMQTEFTDKVDTGQDYGVEADQQLETRATDSSGILNFFSKSVTIRFLTQVAILLSIPPIILVLVLSLLAITITTLFIRTFAGESRV